MSKSKSLSSQLERYRFYLLWIARLQLRGDFHGKVDLSGVVQETLLEAHLAGDRFRQEDEDVQLQWLRRSLACNLRDALRKLGRAVRDVNREQSLENAVEDSAHRIEKWLKSDESTPFSKIVKLEQFHRMHSALGTLPEDQRQVVELRHLRGCKLAEISEQIGRSPAAVAGLLFRGLRTLRAQMSSTP